jgi:hypothetical protein
MAFRSIIIISTLQQAASCPVRALGSFAGSAKFIPFDFLRVK